MRVRAAARIATLTFDDHSSDRGPTPADRWKHRSFARACCPNRRLTSRRN